MTLSEFKDHGGRDGDFMADVFLKMISPYEKSTVPESVRATYEAWAHVQLWDCEARFREAGCTETQIATWRKNLNKQFKRRSAAAIRALRRKSNVSQ